VKKNSFITGVACLAFILTVACSSGTTDAQKNIHWYSLERGIEIAGAEQKKVFLYFWASW